MNTTMSANHLLWQPVLQYLKTNTAFRSYNKVFNSPYMEEVFNYVPNLRVYKEGRTCSFTIRLKQIQRKPEE